MSQHGSQAAPPPADATPRATILVVAGEPSVLSVTSRILERRHFRTLAAQDRNAALTIVRAHAGEIGGAVVDLGLENGGAEALAIELRRYRAALPILFTGSHGVEPSSVWVSSDPADEFLPQPFGLDALAAKAEALFCGQPAAASSGTGPAGSFARRSV